MKNLNIYLVHFFILIVFSNQGQPSWTRIIPSPQENTINFITKIPGTNNLIAVGEGSTVIISENNGTCLVFGENGLVIKTGKVLQFNPPVNFTLEQGYDCPMTIFYLYWEEPDLTNTPDLVGYNIYRNDTLLLTLGPNANEYEEQLSPFGGWGPQICYYITAIYENPLGESIPTEELCGGWLTMVDNNKMDEIKFTCYPNPFKNSISISFKKGFQEQFVVSIYDLSGKLVFNKIFSNNQNEVKFNLPRIENGIYLCNVKFNNGEIVSRKIVKSN
ncbi:MAG: T9SS type A sorting domain-containing protein [Bacteroidales bacterium]|nr:T9SS type A sorting domain-containing protein [Bacteroidales bacterium]